MNKLILFIVGSLLSLMSCEVSGPCSILENGVYRFPDLTVGHMTSEEITRYWELPEDVRNCISTEGLLETCLNYPEWKVLLPDPPGPQNYHLYDIYPVSPQTWFDKRFRINFNGLRELESRSDYPSILTRKYLNFHVLDYQKNWDERRKWRYLLYIAQMEVMLSQYENLAKLEKNEKRALLEEAGTNYLNKGKVEVHCIDKGQSFSVALIARMMYADQFEPMLEVYNENPDVKILVNQLESEKISSLNVIADLIDEYLIYLKKQ